MRDPLDDSEELAPDLHDPAGDPWSSLSARRPSVEAGFEGRGEGHCEAVPITPAPRAGDVSYAFHLDECKAGGGITFREATPFSALLHVLEDMDIEVPHDVRGRLAHVLENLVSQYGNQRAGEALRHVAMSFNHGVHGTELRLLLLGTLGMTDEAELLGMSKQALGARVGRIRQRVLRKALTGPL